MPKRILDIYFNVSFSLPIILVLEPSEDGWKMTYRIADGLIGCLPGKIEGFYFLGNKRYYPILTQVEFRDSIPGWFSENKDRVTCVYPILESLKEEGFKGMVVMICSMLPVDVQDWLDTEIIDRILFVRTGDEPFGEGYSEIDGRLGPGRIVEALANPVSETYIKGTGFVPLCYEANSEKVEIIYEDGGFKMMISPPEERLELHLKALCEDLPPSLYVRRQKGEVEIISAKEEHPWFDWLKWQDVPKELRSVIEAGISKGEFRCPQCDNIHRYDTILCPSGDMILRGMPLDTSLLFAKEKYLSLSEWYAYPLKDNQRIITKQGNLYDWEDGGWRLSRKINPYEEVDDGVWALFHRI